MYTYQDIVSYLNSEQKDYQKGLSIYRVFKHSNQYDRFFSEVADPKEDDPQFIILLEQLHYFEQKYADNAGILPNLANITRHSEEIQLPEIRHIKSRKVKIDEHPYIKIDELPVEQFRLYQENKENWNLLKALHAEMRMLPEDASNNEKRKAILEKMHRLEKRNQDIWKSIDTWYESRELQHQEEQDQKEQQNGKVILPMERKIEKYRRQIAQVKKFLEKPGLRPATFNKYSAQLEVLNRQLDECLQKPVTSL